VVSGAGLPRGLQEARAQAGADDVGVRRVRCAVSLQDVRLAGVPTQVEGPHTVNGYPLTTV
jgi:hypothetical protein